MPKYRYMVWEGAHEHLGELLAEDLAEAGRILKRRLGALQEFVIWPRGQPAPRPRDPWRG